MNSKKKILLANLQPLQRGGAQAVIMSIVRNLSDEYCFDILLFSSQRGWYDEEFESYGGKIIRIPNYEGENKFKNRADLYIRWIRNSRKVKTAISENGPYQAVHTIIAFEAGFVLRQAKKCGVPIRVAHTLVITNISKNKVAMSLYAFFALKAMRRFSTHLVGCTEEACKTMFGEDETAWKLIRNPYDANRFSPNLYPDIKEYTAPALIHIASYNSNKNQLLSIEVLRRITQKYPNASLKLIGFELEKGYYLKIVERIHSYNLENNVTVYPSDADSPKLLSESSYFLLPSVLEGFGIVLIEAQSLGLRCVVSDSVPKLPDCGGCKFLPLSQVDAWAEEIIRDFEITAGKRTPFDCRKFSEEYVMKDYRKMYHNEL